MQFIDPRGSFLKNLVLSLLLLGLSSLLIPIVLKQIDDRKFLDQQRFQAELSRQDKIIDAQAALLDTMASDFWDYEGYAADVLYSRDARNGTGRLAPTRRRGLLRAILPAVWGRCGPRSARCYGWPRNRSYVVVSAGCTMRRWRLFDSCLLELMKTEAASTGGGQPARCVASEGKFAGASWDALKSLCGAGPARNSRSGVCGLGQGVPSLRCA